MQRKFRLTRFTDIKRVRRTGKSYAHPFVVLVVQANEIHKVRVGVTAGRSVGGAIQRNKAKRLLREAIRPLLSDLSPGWDLVLIARSSILTASLQDIRKELTSLLHRTQIVPQTYES